MTHHPECPHPPVDEKPALEVSMGREQGQNGATKHPTAERVREYPMVLGVCLATHEEGHAIDIWKQTGRRQDKRGSTAITLIKANVGDVEAEGRMRNEVHPHMTSNERQGAEQQLSTKARALISQYR